MIYFCGVGQKRGLAKDIMDSQATVIFLQLFAFLLSKRKLQTIAEKQIS